MKRVQVMVVAPSSTVDMATAQGDDIEIEMRDPAELLAMAGVRTVADGVEAWNPVFDVTPAGLIDAIVTERGVVYLMGRVTAREAKRASDIVRGIGGVTKVVRVFDEISEEELKRLSQPPLSK